MVRRLEPHLKEVLALLESHPHSQSCLCNKKLQHDVVRAGVVCMCTLRNSPGVVGTVLVFGNV